MRLAMMTGILFSLFATGAAMAQPDPDEAPLPPSPSRPLPAASGEPTPVNSPAMPAWQATPGGYGGWYGGDYGCHGGCCGSCDSCCHSCRPGLIFRLKMLKCKLCAKWECRRSCRSCCGSSCCGSSCCGSSSCGSDLMMGHDAPTAATHSDLLPLPPTEAAPYDGDDEDDSMDDETPHRPTSARTQVKKQRYTMPRVTTAQKTTRSKKSVQR